MQKMMIVVIVLFATVLSNSARAEESKFKISMTILSGETVISSPVMVSYNNKLATVEIGKKIATQATGNTLRIELRPTQQADGTVHIAVGVKNTEENIVDQQPVKNVRAYDLALKLHLGKTATVNLPGEADKPTTTLNIKVDTVGEN